MSLEQSFDLFKKRILPSVLSPSSKNGILLGDWAKAKGYNVGELANGDPSVLAEILFRAASDDTVITALDWQIKPAKLKLMEENGRAPIQKSASKSENEFADKVKQGEAKDKSAKAEADAQRQINELVDSVQFIGRDGRVSYAKTNEVKQRIIAYVKQQEAAKASLVTVAATVAKFLRDSYEEDEKEKERV